MTPFVVVAWLAAAAGTAGIGWLFARRRHLFVKPSVVLLAASNVLFQWPLALWAGWVEAFMPDPLVPLAFVSIFVLGGLLITSVTWQGVALQVWNGITTQPAPEDSSRVAPILLLIAISAVIAVWYFSVNPLTSTGLFLTVVSPELAAAAREASLKELSSVPLRYGFTTFLSTFGPLLGVLVGLEAAARMRRHQPFRVMLLVLVLLATAAMMSITGARSFAVTLLVAVALAFFLRAGMPVKPVRTMIVLIALILPAAALTIIREGETLTPGILLKYTALVLFNRVLVGPEEVGLWYMHFAQTQGPFGIAAIDKLAGLFGAQGVNPPNIIGLLYAPYVADYVNANASFVFTYYSYFGAFALILVMASLVVLDAFVLLYRWIPAPMLLAGVAVTSVSGLALLSTDFHTALISNGLISTPLIAALVGLIGRRRAASRRS